VARQTGRCPTSCAGPRRGPPARAAGVDADDAGARRPDGLHAVHGQLGEGPVERGLHLVGSVKPMATAEPFGGERTRHLRREGARSDRSAAWSARRQQPLEDLAPPGPEYGARDQPVAHDEGRRGRPHPEPARRLGSAPTSTLNTSGWSFASRSIIGVISRQGGQPSPVEVDQPHPPGASNPRRASPRSRTRRPTIARLERTTKAR